MILRGESVAEEVVAYALTQNVTKVVIGKPQRPRWRDVLFGSVVDDLVRRSGELDIYVITGESEEADDQHARPTEAAQKWDWKGYAVAVGVTVVATGLGWLLFHHLRLENENILMLYLLGVL